MNPIKSYIKEAKADPLTPDELKRFTNGVDIRELESYDIYDLIAIAENMKRIDRDRYDNSYLGIIHDVTNGDPDKMEFLFLEFCKKAGVNPFEKD